MKNFEPLGLNDALLSALAKLGYEAPTPIQEQSIPVLLAGKDLLAQAQTGTGKTAAFALPILNQIDTNLSAPQALILAPTRELAIQVAEAFQSYARDIKGFHVLPIYGGQDYRGQLKGLKRGAHVIVGTPGRVMDHLRRGTLLLKHLKTMVLDEADEMLKMGFIDDVKWILEQIPGKHQTALFSATIPSSIRRIANQHLDKPQEIQIEPHNATVKAIEQFYTLVPNSHKLEALTRLLEVEDFDGVIVFTRTKNSTAALAEKLGARGYACSAINGDMSQNLREEVIKRIKKKSLDILVATDVAARGLDVTRISHVINYDIPHDVESYVHRIGRTGRAGRAGKAFLFVTPRERRMLKDIERAIHQPIASIDTPSSHQINKKRLNDLNKSIIHTIQNKNIDDYTNLVNQMINQDGYNEIDIAAALMYLSQQSKPRVSKKDDEVIASAHNIADDGYGDRRRRPSRKRRSFSGARQQEGGSRRQEGKKKKSHSKDKAYKNTTNSRPKKTRKHSPKKR